MGFKNEDSYDMDTICDLLDKMYLKQLHLIEDKIQCELIIEDRINTGSFHLAKSRYIMGQSSVSKERLPTECSSEFDAAIKTETVEEDNIKQLKLLEINVNESSSKVNPVHWFGVLVPQNLHKAKDIFKNVIDVVVQCANIQLQILENQKSISSLKCYKKSLLKIS